MSMLPCPVPKAPGWRVDWPSITEAFAWIREMKHCPQDSLHHAEGDVWIHVRMVCEALAALPEWRSLPESDRELLFASALLHDVAKPACTRTADGPVTSRGHSQRGSIQARRILWEHAADLAGREHVCALVRYHQIPFYCIERADAQRIALRISQQARCDFLVMLAKADALGRLCADQQNLLLQVSLFEEFCREQGCLHRPYPFPSPLSRFEYFRRPERDPHYQAHDESRCEVILLCGLPGAGKDSWLRTHATNMPVISLDDLRESLGAEPTGNQGEVIQAARERARFLLRDGTSFAWNATNLTRDLRSQLVALFTNYHARVRIVHVEAPPESLFRRNEQRSRRVPPHAIQRMIDRWEVPDVTEAPVVEWWENAERLTRRA